MLHELGLPYETRVIAPRSPAMDDPLFRALSTRGKVPIYQEDDLVMGESGAIATYLADRHRATHGLIPEPGTPERARHDDWCSFTLMELDATALYVVRRHEGLPDIYGEAPVAVDSARDYFRRQAGVVAQALEDGRPYLLGEEFQVADLLLVTCLSWARLISIELASVLAAYEARATSRPAFKEALAANFPPELVAAMRKLAKAGGSA
jgi:glutathione S-transferase